MDVLETAVSNISICWKNEMIQRDGGPRNGERLRLRLRLCRDRLLSSRGGGDGVCGDGVCRRGRFSEWRRGR